MFYHKALHLIVGFIVWLSCVAGRHKLDFQPHDHLKAFIGETLNVTCRVDVDDSSPGIFNLSRIIFRVYKNTEFEHNVTSDHVTALNSTVVALAYPNVTAALEGAFIQCCIDSCGDQSATASSVMIRINKQPPVPEITQYEVENWDTFWFKWHLNTEANYRTAVFRSWYKNSNQTDYIQCNTSVTAVHTCFVDKPFDAALTDGFFDIKVNVSNNYRNVSSREIRVQLHDIVRPHPPSITSRRAPPVGSDNSKPKEFFVKFSPPKKGKSTTYTIHVACRNGTFSRTWERTPTDGDLMNSEISERIADLPCYATCYVRVRAAASQMVNRADYLSDWSSDRSFETTPDVPVGVPEVCSSCFQLVRGRGSEITGVIVYTKPLPDEVACGRVINYQASIQNGTHRWKLDIPATSHPLLNITSPYSGKEFLKVDVIACTTVGCYNGPQHLDVIHIPGQKYVPTAPRLLAVAYGERRAVCRWKPGPTGEHYFIFSCSGRLNEAGLCTSRVDWRRIAGNETNTTFVLPAGEDARKYVFGIAVETAAEHVSSGIAWSNCTRSVDSTALRNKLDIQATPVDCCELMVTIARPECHDGESSGYVEAFQVAYCPVDGNDKDEENCLDDLVTREIPAGIDETNFVLRDLEPVQRYILIVKSLSANGYTLRSDSILAGTGAAPLSSGIIAAIVFLSVLLLIFMSIGIYTLCRFYQKLIAKIRLWCGVDIVPPSKDNQLYANGEDSLTGDRLLMYSHPRDLPPATAASEPEPLECPVVDIIESDFIQPDQSLWVDFKPEPVEKQMEKCDPQSRDRLLPSADDFTFPDDEDTHSPPPIRRILPAMSDSNVELPRDLSDIVDMADGNIDSGNSGKQDSSGYAPGEAKDCLVFDSVPDNNPCPIRVDFDFDKKRSLLPSIDSSGDMMDSYFDSGQSRKTSERLLPLPSSGMLAVDNGGEFGGGPFLDADVIRTSSCSNDSSDVDPYSKTRFDS